MQTYGLQPSPQFSEGHKHPNVLLLSAQGSSPAAGDAPSRLSKCGHNATSKEMGPRRQEQRPPSAPPEATQQRFTPHSLHGALKLKMNHIGFIPPCNSSTVNRNTRGGVSPHQSSHQPSCAEAAATALPTLLCCGLSLHPSLCLKKGPQVLQHRVIQGQQNQRLSCYQHLLHARGIKRFHNH